MKKIYLFASLIAVVMVLGLVIVSSVNAVDIRSGNPPYQSVWGNLQKSGSFVAYGRAKDTASGGHLATASMTITAGDPVVLAGTTYPLSVSLTTSAVDTAFFGIAVTDATIGNEIQIATWGKWRARATPLAITYGDILVTSGTAGDLTGTAVVAEALYTPLSVTALAVRALETKTTTASDDTILVEILGR